MTDWELIQQAQQGQRIAKTHPNAEVRKSAIFWLGETDSDKALDVLVGILKE